ncbi:ABC transporter substrate-binding protein [Haloterrigena longa]|uniref:ABC transporter substrate-binding protein n=2 Tax=Natrinema longum TaxID=370324 RepID=A0A8A2UEF7_9EURY|nr:ABC transporter substrate-binding protein [Natrinema longum]MBZ6496107.1 ABC transporter substrate-binding protein [Natrinema longum]QSW86934.1 ABC transporter substrate-binding protein [Natrinema longum]
MLAATAGATLSTSGCLRQVRDIVVPDNIKQLSVTITTLPADADRQGVRIAGRLEDAFEAVGIDASIDVRSEIEFRRTVLYDHEFDICIGRHPGGTDPDFLYEALYSRYADESGWQNPFGFADQDIDELLDAQRNADGDNRRKVVTEVLDAIATDQPFVPICIPEEHRVVRTDRFDDWEAGHLATRHGYLGLDPIADAERLNVAHTDSRPTENLNPIAADYRGRGAITELVYDSVATQNGTNALQPWLASSWEWDDNTVSVDLRENCTFHDGEPVTAGDVAFTYRFLQDLSLGNHEAPSPAPRFRAQADAIETIDVVHGSRLEMTMDTNRTVGERAFLVPILPAHVWRERAGDVMGPGGPTIAQGTTEGVVANNVPPIGSGPFRFERRTEGDLLVLTRFDDHFTRRLDVDLPEPTVDECRFRIHPDSTGAARVVQEGTADVTSLPLRASLVDTVTESDDVRLLESPSWTFYFLGFNTRKPPFGNFQFRRVVAQLIDKEWLCDEIFAGRARPIASPVPDEWTPAELEWDGYDPETPFLGSDGEVDVSSAKSAFEAAGFRYDDQGRLRARQ